MIDDDLVQTQTEPEEIETASSLVTDIVVHENSTTQPGEASTSMVAEPAMDDIEGHRRVATADPELSQDEQESLEVNRIRPKEFEQLTPGMQAQAVQSIDMLLDVTLPISIELGRTAMSIEDVLNLGPGSIVELNKLAGEPVDLLVNDKLVAHGEVVVVDENFGIRITSMVSQQERIKSLK